ncbi:MAG: hypothetical protein DCF15_08370 [Phormidesmis priestleyi]|uniref:Uncharacterized protein n=1 Tax=Phormidesmis priestleyi TaxID=268141 RepID=A0A2W4XH05_9CYAN|nr:MAG: hypothetical protein DCF15_08370 [Phormidesmis priestleyi]
MTSPLEQSSEPLEDAWLVVARNSRVNSLWEALCARNSEERSKECYRHLSLTPTKRKRNKIFPLRGKKYEGAWEYKFPSGDRVFYVPDTQIKKVEVYYADKHPKKKAPEP